MNSADHPTGPPGRGWHADETLLAAYAEDHLDQLSVLSLEAHLLACAPCRRTASSRVPPEALSAVWQEVVATLDAPRASLPERALQRLGVPEHIARLLVATPSLSGSWLAGVATVLAFAVLAAHATADPRAVGLFLLLAPVLPVAAVAASYGTFLDLTAEVSVAAPMDSFRLLLLRALAAVSVTLVPTAVAAAVLPSGSASALVWLLPALALTTATLALERIVPATWAAGGLLGAWALAALATANPVTGSATTFVAFQPTGQLVSAAITCLGAAVLTGVARTPAADHLDRRSA